MSLIVGEGRFLYHDAINKLPAHTPKVEDKEEEREIDGSPATAKSEESCLFTGRFVGRGSFPNTTPQKIHATLYEDTARANLPKQETLLIVWPVESCRTYQTMLSPAATAGQVSVNGHDLTRRCNRVLVVSGFKKLIAGNRPWPSPPSPSFLIQYLVDDGDNHRPSLSHSELVNSFCPKSLKTFQRFCL